MTAGSIEHLRARQLWTLLEPLSAILYYSPAATAVAGRLGYRTDTRWPSFFAWRAAPLGAATATEVTDTFYSFAPAMVARYVPSIWATATPAAVLNARTEAVDAAFTILDPLDQPDRAFLKRAADLLRAAAETADTTGRPLAAANAAQPWPTQPHLVLWQAATLLREHRGDGHLIALREAGLDGCEALVSFAAVGAAPREAFDSRGWPDAAWQAAAHRLRDRGLLNPDGTATAAGRQLRDHVEVRTDELAAQPWHAVDLKDSDALGAFLRSVRDTIRRTGVTSPTSTLGMTS